MEYISYLDTHIDEEHLSAMKSLVNICREFEPITLSFPLPSGDEGADVHYYSFFQDKICIAVLGVCLFPFLTDDDQLDFNYEITAFVHPNYRRQGLFKTLFQKFLETENVPERSKTISFLSDRHCPASIFVAIAMSMKNINTEYLMQFDLTKQTTIPSSLIIKKCRNRRILTRHYSHIFDMSTDIARSYVDSTLDSNDNVTPFIIRLDNKTPIGSGYIMYASPQKAYLFSFGILPEYQGKGLGYLALLSLKNYLPETYEKITVQVSGHNIPACKLYEKVGFTLKQQLLFYGWE